MRMDRRDHRAVLAVVAVLVLATAWVAVGDLPVGSGRDVASVGHLERNATHVVSSVDLGGAVSAPVLGAPRPADPRPAPLWVLPGLFAGLAALCLFRRQRLRPNRSARRVLLRGSVSNRAPPIESFA
ncbi:MAG: hypothetical protein ACXVKQ_17545 [Acidimicrobiia bacterium]